jgi:hypothetical protein
VVGQQEVEIVFGCHHSHRHPHSARKKDDSHAAIIALPRWLGFLMVDQETELMDRTGLNKNELIS